MISLTTYREIVNNPIWKDHLRTVQDFHYYLSSTDDMTFRVSGVYDWLGAPLTVTHEIPYIHRWTPVYKASVLARFYQLEDHFKEHHTDTITMLTLTTYHAVYQSGKPSKNSTATIEEAFNVLKTAWLKLSADIRKGIGIPYIWIMEPHKTGYPHIHVILFGKLRQGQQEKIKRLWSLKYGAGSYKHGAEFTEKTAEESIKSIRNYLMKYMVKAWKDGKWTTAQLVFNALVWKNGWRLWGSTRDITEIMKRHAPEKTEIDWQLTEMKSGRYADHCAIWRKDGTNIIPETA